MKKLLFISLAVLLSINTFAQDKKRHSIAVSGTHEILFDKFEISGNSEFAKYKDALTLADYNDWGIGVSYGYFINNRLQITPSVFYHHASRTKAKWEDILYPKAGEKEGQDTTWHLIPAGEAFAHNPSALEFNLNVRYLIPLAEKVSVYPFVGFVSRDFVHHNHRDNEETKNTRFGINAGLGINYALTETEYLTFAAKYSLFEDHVSPIRLPEQVEPSKTTEGAGTENDPIIDQRPQNHGDFHIKLSSLRFTLGIGTKF